MEEIIRHHHEWMNGSGYPDGLMGKAIPLGSRVLAVVDAWFSLTTDRSFRKGLAAAAARAEIEAHAGTQFDPAVVNMFGKWRDSLEDRDEARPRNPEPNTQE